jgi:hypothetical protein
MENNDQKTDTETNPLVNSSIASTPQNIIIVILSILLIFSFLGINILDILSNIIKLIIKIFSPLVTELLSILGYTSGSIINKTADVAADVGKGAIDIGEGAVQGVGDLLIKASRKGVDSEAANQLDSVLSIDDKNANNLVDDPEDPIQKPISSSKAGWCLVGEFDNRRSCIQVNEYDKCMSGQIFPNREQCLKIR